MALGKRKAEQQAAWIATNELPKSPGHPFYKKLNVLLAEAGFDPWLEKLCAPYYAEMGRESIPPGVYFRMILVGYFEGISSQRGIAWRCSDSRSLAEFLGVPAHEETPDHSSLSRIHGRLPLEVHEAMFLFVLKLAAENQLLAGKTVAVDSTMLEADAAMKSIVRRATGENWKTYLRGLAAETGLENPTDDELRRFDKTRRDKKVSNDDWVSPNDPESRIARMKDGTTHAAYKAEHVVDLDTDLVLSATIYPADRADTETLAESVVQAQLNVIAVESPANIQEAVADKGYHAAEMLATVNQTLGIRTYIPEPKRKTPWKWSERSEAERAAVTGNHRRVRGRRSKKLQRLRSEYVERSFAHVCETGGARRCWLHGLLTVSKRYLLQVAARNLGLIMRKLFGIGTPKSLQKEADLAAPAYLLMSMTWCIVKALLTALAAHGVPRIHPRVRPPMLATAA
ncbi:MAG: transposase [Bryobacteraceae bacterium]